MSVAPETEVDLRIPGLRDSLRIHVHGEQDLHVSRRLREEGIWEPYETALLLSLLYARRRAGRDGWRPDDVLQLLALRPV